MNTSFKNPSEVDQLFFACQEGDDVAFDRLISSGVDPNALDGFCFDRPIHVAVVNRKANIVEKLLRDKRVEPELAGGGYYTPMEIAKMHGYYEIIDLLKTLGGVHETQAPRNPEQNHSITKGNKRKHVPEPT